MIRVPQLRGMLDCLFGLEVAALVKEVLRVASRHRLVLLVRYHLLAVLDRCVLALTEAAMVLLSEHTLRRSQTLGSNMMLGAISDSCGIVRGCVSVQRPHVVVENLRFLVEGLEVDWVEVFVWRCTPAGCSSSSRGFVVELSTLGVFGALISQLMMPLSSVRGLLARLCSQGSLESLALSAIRLLEGDHVRMRNIEVL